MRLGRRHSIWGRFADGGEHLLQVDPQTGVATFRSGDVEVDFEPGTHRPLQARFPRGPVAAGTRLDMRAYHVLRTLLAGMLDAAAVHMVNTPQF